MFQAATKEGKEEGRGEVDSKPSICEVDLKLISEYFNQSMISPPNAQKLQEIVLFNIICYTGHRGRENLRRMTKDTFKVFKDPDGCHYIQQVKKELTKNHTEKDTDQTNMARIYERLGKTKFYTILKSIIIKVLFFQEH